MPVTSKPSGSPRSPQEALRSSSSSPPRSPPPSRHASRSPGSPQEVQKALRKPSKAAVLHPGSVVLHPGAAVVHSGEEVLVTGLPPGGHQGPAWPRQFSASQGTSGTSLASTPSCLPGDFRDEPDRNIRQPPNGLQGPA